MASRQKNQVYIRQLTLTALMAALSIVLTRVVSILIIGGSNRIGLGLVPIHLTGFLLGPFWGALCGLISDLIGVLINPMGTVFWGITVTTVLQGVIPGIVIRRWKGKDSRGVAIALVISFVFLSLLMQSYWLSILMGRPFTEMVAVRALPQLGFTIAYIVLEVPLYALLKRSFIVSEERTLH